VAKAPATIIAAAAILKVGFFNGKLLSIESLSEASRDGRRRKNELREF
jgi:hypothetical protein